MSATLTERPIRVECYWNGKGRKPDVLDGRIYVDVGRGRIGFTRLVKSAMADWYWEAPLSDVSRVVTLEEGSSAAMATLLDVGTVGEAPERKDLVMILFLEGDRIGIVEPGKDAIFKFPVSEIRSILSEIS